MLAERLTVVISNPILSRRCSGEGEVHDHSHQPRRHLGQIEALMATGNSACFNEATEVAVEHLPKSMTRALVRSLCHHSDYMIRDDAVELLADIGEDEDLWCLLVMSHDPHWIVRCSAAHALASRHLSEARKRIRSMATSDPNGIVRMWAYTALYDQEPEDPKLPKFLIARLAKEKLAVARLNLLEHLVILGFKEYETEFHDLGQGKGIRTRFVRARLRDNYLSYLERMGQSRSELAK